MPTSKKKSKPTSKKSKVSRDLVSGKGGRHVMSEAHASVASSTPIKVSRDQQKIAAQRMPVSEKGGRRSSSEAQIPDNASSTPIKVSKDHMPADTREARVSEKGGRQSEFGLHGVRASSDLIDTIREQWRRRQAWHRGEKSLTLQAKAMCRRLAHFELGNDATMKAVITEAGVIFESALNGREHKLAETAFGAIAPLIQARAALEPMRASVEKELEKLAKQLPIAPWVESVKGFGYGSLAAVIGEAGDPGNYAGPAKVWKRMGLAVMKDGRQRKVEGAAAIEHGYNPSRRSVVWNIGESILKAQIRRAKDADGNKTAEVSALGKYGELYLKRKAYEIEQAKKQGLTVCPAAEIPEGKKSEYRSDGHIHNRAKRYMEKIVLLDLWQAWKDTNENVVTH